MRALIPAITIPLIIIIDQATKFAVKTSMCLYEKVEVGFDSADISLRTTNDKAEVTINGKKAKADENGTYHVTIDLTKQSECKIEVACGKEEKLD